MLTNDQCIKGKQIFSNNQCIEEKNNLLNDHGIVFNFFQMIMVLEAKQFFK
jgi:hypothetical protein